MIIHYKIWPQRIVFFLWGELFKDSRVLRAVRTALSEGLDVIVLSYGLHGSSEFEKHGPIKIYKLSNSSLIGKLRKIKQILFKRKSRSSNPKNLAVNKLGFTILDFFFNIGIGLLLFFKYHRFKANIYHAHDLDMLLPSVLFAKLHGGNLIYEMHEFYAEQFADTQRSSKKLYTI